MAQDYQLLIDGQWVDGDAGTTSIVNPATEAVVAEAPEASVAQAEAAAAAAQAALPGWAATSPADRAELLQAAGYPLPGGKGKRQSAFRPANSLGRVTATEEKALKEYLEFLRAKKRNGKK